VTPKLACARLLGIGVAAALSATAAWSQPAAKAGHHRLDYDGTAGVRKSGAS